MSDDRIEEAGGSGKSGFTDSTTTWGEADKLLPQLPDGLVSGGVLVDILWLANIEENTKGFKGPVCFEAGEGGLAVNSD